jgi:small subunit ribosomal protein S16
VAATIRLQRHGRTKSPQYRLVATNHENKRDGKFIEILGTFNPKVEPPAVNLKEERIKYWIGVGAIVKGVSRKLIKDAIPGLIEKREDNVRKKIQAARKKRKARLSGKAAKATKAKK